MSLIPLCYALGFSLGGGLSKTMSLSSDSLGYFVMASLLLGLGVSLMSNQLLQKRGATGR